MKQKTLVSPNLIKINCSYHRVIHYDDVIMTMLASQITSLTVVYSIVYSGVNQRKHQSSASLAFVREIHRGPVNFPHKWPVTRKMFPFDDVIMWKSWGIAPSSIISVTLFHLTRVRGQYITVWQQAGHSMWCWLDCVSCDRLGIMITLMVCDGAYRPPRCK